MATNITFRTQLLGSMTEFCAASGLSMFSNALNMVDLVVALARYKEEGVRLSPQVYISNDIGSLTAMLPDGERVVIGSTESNLAGIKTALKKTAPLATGGWAIYLQDKEGLEYGLFRGSSNPLSVAIDDILLDKIEPLSVVKVFSIAEECVEIRASNGLFHHVFLDHRKDDSPPPLKFLEQLVASIVENSAPIHREALSSFLKKLLFNSMRESHGCIVAVTTMKRPPAFLANDGILLKTPIDFCELVGELQKASIDASVLSNKGALLQGMLNSDGIILFDNRGRLLGYNCFVKLTNENVAVGGARRRAFVALKAKIGKGLAAAFIQSQDGWTDFEGVPNAK